MYLDSILISHRQSGFCVLEFSLSESRTPYNLQVIKSSSDEFAELASRIVFGVEFKLKELGHVSNGKFRLPMYFKNSLPETMPFNNGSKRLFKVAV